MAIDREIDPRRELYDDFKSKLETNRQDLFYDVEDLLDIYTYADDESDNYVMLEVVNIGTRLYPDNEEISLRRAIVLDMLGMYEEAWDGIKDIEASTPYARLVKARLTPSKTGKERLEMLNKIVDEATSLDEDDIIQISELSRYCGQSQWLADNIERIRGKAEYMPTLFYELAVNAIEENDYDTAMKMVEELVDNEPMKLEFWEMYAEVAYNLSDYDRADSGADFALAIDEESKRGRLIKGFIKVMRGEIDEGRALIETSYLDPDISSAHAACVLAMSYANEPEKAKKALIDYINSCQTIPHEPLTALAAIDPHSAMPYVSSYVETYSMMGQEAFINWAAELIMAGAGSTAAMVLEMFEKTADADDLTIDFYETIYQTYYRAGMYGRIIERFEDASKRPPVIAVAAWLAFIMALARTEHNEQLMIEIARLKERSTSMSLADVMRVTAFEAEMRLTYLGQALDRILKVTYGSLTLDQADPFLHVSVYIKG